MRSSLEIGIGLLFLVGAVFHATYTLRHGDEFFGSFARGTWLGPAGRVVHDVVVANATLFAIALMVFQAMVAILILTRGPLVGPALFAGGCFALTAALVSSTGGAAANLALAATQFALAATR